MIYYSNNEPVKPEQERSRETSAQPETRQTLTKSECEKLYDTTLQDYSINKQAGKETEINELLHKVRCLLPKRKTIFFILLLLGPSIKREEPI